MKSVLVSPETAKMIQNDHPWIIKDAYTARFPADEIFLLATTTKSSQSTKSAQSKLGIFLHDPHHPHIKGRMWDRTKTGTILTLQAFSQSLLQRLQLAFQKRRDLGLPNERENYYLVFGEADGIPGLFIQKQGTHLLLQSYASFWKGPLREILFTQLNQALFENSCSNVKIWIQERGPHSPFQCTSSPPQEPIQIMEFDLTYSLDLRLYDFGLYTDMAAIRKSLTPFLKPGHEALNLFCYTGAFSLFFLKHGLKVTSVDLSRKNIDWLMTNLSLNPQLHLDLEDHRSLVLSCEKALEKLQREKQKFDFILCDPPPLISLGGKKSKTKSSLQFYEIYLEELLGLLKPTGRLCLFVNTHKISALRVQNKIQGILKNPLLKKRFPKATIEKTLRLAEDCPQLSSFPEGDYLKGLIVCPGDSS